MILASCCALFLLYRIATLWPTRHQRTRAWWIGVGTAVIAAAGLVVGVVGDIAAQKTVALLLLPAGLAWMLLIVVALAAWRVAPRWLAALATAAALLYTLAGNSWLGDALIASLERRIPPHDLERMPPCDAVCVLGGGSEIDEDGAALLAGAGDRIALAARLWHAGKTRLVVVSGNGVDGLDDARDLRRETTTLLRDLGVDPRAIVAIPGTAVNTTQEIAAYAPLIRAEGWRRVGLVSSAWHLPRALRLCRAAGLEVVPLGADRRGRFRGWSPYWLVPQEHGFERVHRACWEYLGMLVGR